MRSFSRSRVIVASSSIVAAMAWTLVAIGADEQLSRPGHTEPDALAFAVDLERHAVDDVRQFVGPAAIKLSGHAGAYRWKRVGFGSDEVDLRVSMVGTSGPCRVYLRLIEDGEPIADQWFTSVSAAREEHVSTIAVDYADTRLKIDSDCDAWSARFRPVGDPELAYTVDEQTYAVRANSRDALGSAIQRIGGRWAAYTEWFIGWVYVTEQTEDGCRVSNGETWLRASTTLPIWRQPIRAEPTLVADWERFIESLQTHELGHVTIALQGADAIDDRLDLGFDAPTCEEAREQAEAAADAILERANRRSARYDAITAHGASQGASLD